jgi:hypothetical protein
MELFPAADDNSLTLIKSVIDDSDYYLVILGGRYGTVDAATGKSFTHLEYEYALTAGKPTIALLRSNPGTLPADKTEATDVGRKRFDDFRSELRRKNCRDSSDRGELTAAVFTGVQHLKKTRPGVGWIRTPDGVDGALKDELLRVRREMDSLNAELMQARRRNPPSGTEELASGPDQTTIVVQFDEGIYSYQVEWEEIIRSVLPQTFGAGGDHAAIRLALVSLARAKAEESRYGPPPACWEGSTISSSSFGKVINQMVALGLVEGIPHPQDPLSTRWRATPYGAQEGCRLVAVRRK